MPISPARKIAFEVLLRVDCESSYASDLLHSRLDSEVSPRDAALATELVMGSLRWQRLLDFFASQYARRLADSLDGEVRVALRIGIYQLRFLTRIPEHAAVNESVEFVKRGKKRSAAAFVNAVLRRAAREKNQPVANFLPEGMTAAERIAILNSHPTWLVERWLERFGEPKTLELLEANNRAPLPAFAFIGAGSSEEAIRVMNKSGLDVEPGRFMRQAVILPGGSRANQNLPHEKCLAMQDEASQMIPLLLGVENGQSILDLCAAPGGKTVLLAWAAGGTGFIVAADRYEHRLHKMRDRWRLANSSNIFLIALDGTAPLPFNLKFERILVDAPCSGTGTLARNPEIRWRLRKDDLDDLHRKQVALLVCALDCLAPGGRLVFSTCSLEPEENDQVVSEVLRARPEFRTVRAVVPRGELADGVSPDTLIASDGTFRTFPPEHHTDGFFAALITRKQS
jgi:16S rRNA (cytosine967-C5)-methyltransferase